MTILEVWEKKSGPLLRRTEIDFQYVQCKKDCYLLYEEATILLINLHSFDPSLIFQWDLSN